MSRRSGWLAGPWLAVVSPVVLILGWEVASATGLLRGALFPRPSTVLAGLPVGQVARSVGPAPSRLSSRIATRLGTSAATTRRPRRCARNDSPAETM